MEEATARLDIFLVGEEILALFHQCVSISLCLYCADMAANHDGKNDKEYLFHKRFYIIVLFLTSYLYAKVEKK